MLQDLIKFLLGFLKTLLIHVLLYYKGFFNNLMTLHAYQKIGKELVVTPIYKKGDKSLPKNYRPISLTCISCKVMEHIVLSSMSRHFSNNDIITPLQHGFRKGFSTVTQLITVLDNWFSSLDKRTRTGVLLLDFSRAFDSVPHQRLVHKLHYFGVRNRTLEWIKSFLLGRCQRLQKMFCVQPCNWRRRDYSV